ncbi:MAG: YihY/virulence factor BrkB family protein [Candidatus Hydrogenedentes bacterium]|nr:YihY/virulence factor BrkB family protein [Candidatus Hydrogenedentota bacterium]
MRAHLQRLFDALARGQRFITHDIWFLGREGEEVPYGFVVKQIRVLIVLVQNMIQDALLLRAAALAYTTVLSLVPFVAVLYFVISQFNLTTEITSLIAGFAGGEPAVQGGANRNGGGAEDPNEQIKELINLVIPGLSDSMSSERVPSGDLGPGGEPSLVPERGLAPPDSAALPEREGPPPPAAGEEPIDPVDLILDMASKSANPRALGLMGLGFILTAVFGLMRNIESSFNSIWGLRSTRSWYRMFSDYMMITLLLPFVVMGVIGLTAALGSTVVTDRLGYIALAVRGIQYLVIWFAFTALYAVVPNTKVKWRYAILGGFVAGTLWLLLSMGYFGLQYGLARNSVVYSSFALFPFLLIWIYFSWVILLFGAELTFAYQNEKTFVMERHAAGASQAYREAVALRAMVEIAHRFDAGMPGLAPSEAAEEWKVPTRLLNETLDQLDEADLVQRCATEPVRFAPSRSIDKITIGHVIAALRESGREPSALREEEILQPLLREVSGSESKLMREPLSEVIHRLHPPHPALAVDGEHETKALPDGTSSDGDSENDRG